MDTESILRALADPTRLRVVRLLGAMELAVGELAQVLGQSQPRVSRHVGILCDAGLAERRREGSWVFLRAPLATKQMPATYRLLMETLASAEGEDEALGALCEADRQKLTAVRSARGQAAEDYFARHADEWDELRRMHIAEALVEDGLKEALGNGPIGTMLDVGTGTGRMAELFAPDADHVVALDKNLDMLRVARAKLQNLPAASVELVQGDFVDLPFAKAHFDTIVLHQVLHFAPDPKQALCEAGRVTRAGGRIAIIDFESHSREELRERHAHAWLGFSDKQIEKFLQGAGFTLDRAIAFEGEELVVKIWLGERVAAKVAA